MSGHHPRNKSNPHKRKRNPHDEDKMEKRLKALFGPSSIHETVESEDSSKHQRASSIHRNRTQYDSKRRYNKHSRRYFQSLKDTHRTSFTPPENLQLYQMKVRNWEDLFIPRKSSSNVNLELKRTNAWRGVSFDSNVNLAKHPTWNYTETTSFRNTSVKDRSLGNSNSRNTSLRNGNLLEIPTNVQNCKEVSSSIFDTCPSSEGRGWNSIFRWQLLRGYQTNYLDHVQSEILSLPHLDRIVKHQKFPAHLDMTNCIIHPSLDRVCIQYPYFRKVYARGNNIASGTIKEFDSVLESPSSCDVITDYQWKKNSLYISSIGNVSSLEKWKLSKNGQWKLKPFSFCNSNSFNTVLSFHLASKDKFVLGLPKSLQVYHRDKCIYSTYSSLHSDVTKVRFLNDHTNGIAALRRNGEASLHDTRYGICFQHKWEIPAVSLQQSILNFHQFIVSYMDGSLSMFDIRRNLSHPLITYKKGRKTRLAYASALPEIQDDYIVYGDPIENTLQVFAMNSISERNACLFEAHTNSSPRGWNIDTTNYRLMCITEDHQSHYFSWDSSRED